MKLDRITLKLEKTMQISEPLIRYYLADILLCWFNSNDLPPDDISAYYKYVLEMQKGAVKHGDMDVLKLAFEYMLSQPEFDFTRLNESNYPYDNEDIREIIFYAWQTLWPNGKNWGSKDAIDIELVTIPIQEWWANRNLVTTKSDQVVSVL